MDPSLGCSENPSEIEHQESPTIIFKHHIHHGRLTWNLQITHFERKMIFQTSMIMFHVNLQGCRCSCERKNNSRAWYPSVDYHVLGDPYYETVFHKGFSGTLQGINISYLGKRKFIFKSAFLWDMLVPRRVHINIINTSHIFMSCWALPASRSQGLNRDPFIPSFFPFKTIPVQSSWSSLRGHSHDMNMNASHIC